MSDVVANREPVSLDEIGAYLAEKGVRKECPHCGHDTWMVSNSDPGNPFAGVSAQALDGKSQQMATYVPFFLILCRNCGIARMLAWGAVETWKAEKAQPDDG